MMPALAIKSNEFRIYRVCRAASNSRKLSELDELNKLDRILFFFLNVNDLTALVHAGLGVDTVRHLSLAGIFVGVELRGFQRVMSTALTRACMGMSSFWIWHY
jgi:hypothetical protein